MSEPAKPFCPECRESVVEPATLNRREFFRTVGERTAAVAVLSSAGAALPAVAADKPQPAATPAKPAEDLVRELHASLSEEQRGQVVLPWNHGVANGKGTPTRLGMYNAPIQGKKIGPLYRQPQQELIDRILRAISNGEDGYRQISRNGTFDSSGSLQNCGALFFGEPADGQKFSWVFSGHHLTVRCDGNSEEAAAFGGPMYYGHSPGGYSDRNIFFYQTRQVLNVFDALSEAQRKQAIVPGTPGEGAGSVRFRSKGQERPGITIAQLSRDQRELVERVMRSVLSPYRKEDADEVMDIVKATGGMDRIHLAFYKDSEMDDGQRWHFWRLEGPGFVWNYRVLPHVHCYVNISSKV